MIAALLAGTARQISRKNSTNSTQHKKNAPEHTFPIDGDVEVNYLARLRHGKSRAQFSSMRGI